MVSSHCSSPGVIAVNCDLPSLEVEACLEEKPCRSHGAAAGAGCGRGRPRTVRVSRPGPPMWWWDPGALRADLTAGLCFSLQHGEQFPRAVRTEGGGGRSVQVSPTVLLSPQRGPWRLLITLGVHLSVHLSVGPGPYAKEGALTSAEAPSFVG